MNVCVCVYVYVHVCECVCMSVWPACIHVTLSERIYACMCVVACVCACVSLYKSMSEQGIPTDSLSSFTT